MLAFFVLLLLQGPPSVPGPPTVPGYVQKETPVERQSAYDLAASRAIEQRLPLAIFVGMPARSLSGVMSVRVDTYNGSAEPRIVVGRVGQSGEALDTRVGDADILRAAGVGVQRAPFVPPDDSDLAAGPWPQSLPFPEGLRRYRRARRTQSIAVVDGRDSIQPVSRFDLEAKWHVPGGLMGVEDWKSDLYRVLPSAPAVWIGNIDVLNSFGNYQANRGYKRSYPAGTMFADVLSHKGRVFEVRYAEKREDGTWDRYVAFKDAAARPIGYLGLQGQRCASCHDGFPGSGNYGSGLIPGGDSIFSDPFAELER